MCLCTDIVRSVCLYVDNVQAKGHPEIRLCWDKRCQGQHHVVRLDKGWCSACIKALQGSFSEKELVRPSTIRRYWVSMMRSKDVETPDPTWEWMISKVSETELTGDLVAKADKEWDKKMEAKISGFVIDEIRVANKKWKTAGLDKRRLGEIVEEARLTALE